MGEGVDQTAARRLAVGLAREAVGQLGADHYLGWVRDMGEEGRAQYEELQTRIDVATELVPEELALEWAALGVMLGDWSEYWAALDFDQVRMNSPEGDARARL